MKIKFHPRKGNNSVAVDSILSSKQGELTKAPRERVTNAIGG